jgi:hypothetical protein
MGNGEEDLPKNRRTWSRFDGLGAKLISALT